MSEPLPAERQSPPLESLESKIIRVGIFLIFLATFGDYVFQKVWAIIGPLVR